MVVHLISGIIFVAILGFLQPIPVYSQTEPIVFSVGWLPQGHHVGHFAALGKGYYKEQGLDVTIVRGYGGMPTINVLAAGKFDFAGTGAGSIIMARSKGIQLRAVAILLDRGIESIFALEGSGVTKPKDLEGRSAAVTFFGTPWEVFPALAVVNGIDLKKVKLENVEAGALIASVMGGRADAVITFETAFPILKEAAEKAKKKAVNIRYRDWGVDIYSTALMAMDKLIAERPELVRRFVAANMKGHQWAIQYPEEATGVFLGFNPNLDKRLTYETCLVAIDSMVSPTALSNGLGYMTEDRWKYTRDIVAKPLKLDPVPPVQDLFTNDFLPRLIPVRSTK